MPATFLEGRRRSGKSLYAVLKIQEYLKEGRKVATNLDLHLEHLMPDDHKASVIRLPDCPRSEDLFAIGQAYPELDANNPDTYDENKNGVVVLDELLTFFNSRAWNEKDRANVINWIVLSGKLGWDLIFIGQSFDAIDTQIRDTVIDRIGSCTSNENLYPGFFWNYIIKPIYIKAFGKKNFVFMYIGKAKSKENFSHRITHKRDDLWVCYNTAQIFKKDVELRVNEKGKEYQFDHRAMYSRIGKHYFDEPKAVIEASEPEQVEESEVVPDQKKTSFSKTSLLLLVSTLLFAFLYFTKPTAISSESTAVVKNEVKTSDRTPVNKSSFEEQKVKLSDSDLGQIYVSCSQYRTDGNFDYCFSDKDGHVVKPEYIGYQVLYVGQCHAKLIRQGVELDVYCNPVIVQPDAPVNYEEVEAQYASVN